MSMVTRKTIVKKRVERYPVAMPIRYRVVATLSLLVNSTLAGWVDPDTALNVHTVTSLTKTDIRKYKLVFSDEFEQDGRTFHDGRDPRWTALNKNDNTNNPLHYYSHDNIRTSNGVLQIKSELESKHFRIHNKKTKEWFNGTKTIKSGMLQSWNKFCFVGGIVEFSAKLPGDSGTAGLWPAIWLLGNLARATYIHSSDFLWPFSTNICDNRTDHIQAISACSRRLRKPRGRGAPEIDIFEILISDAWPHPIMSSSLQVAPGIETNRPVVGHAPNASHTWYTGVEYGKETNAALNIYFYGVKVFHKLKEEDYQTDAISTNMVMNTTSYERQTKYRLEWDPPTEEDGSGGYLRWFIDGHLVQGFRGEMLEVSHTQIPSEPMYLIMNTAVSKDWGFPDAYFKNCKYKCWDCADPRCRKCALPKNFCDNFPAYMEIDYIRVYQADDEPKHIIGCSPECRPTEQWIGDHLDDYMLHGETRPLQPIICGGSSCTNDKDCGGSDKGTCSSLGCSCSSHWTGPNCRAHAAFYDDNACDDCGNCGIGQMILQSAPESIYFGCSTVAAIVLYLIWKQQGKAKTLYLYSKLSTSQESSDGVGENSVAMSSSNATVSYQRTG